jgi:uncharacterized membrane protein
MTYCAQCGSQVEGQFCPKCGAAVGAAPNPAPNPAPAGNQSLGMEENLASALAYIPIVGLIFLLVDPYKNNKVVKFHSLQSLFYCGAWIVIGIALAIFSAIMFAILPYSMAWLSLTVWRLVELGLVIGWIIMVVKAYQRQRFVMPIIGPLAEKQV